VQSLVKPRNYIFLAVFEKALPYCPSADQATNLWMKYIEFLRRRISFDSIVQSDVDLFMNTTKAAESHLMKCKFFKVSLLISLSHISSAASPAEPGGRFECFYFRENYSSK